VKRVVITGMGIVSCLGNNQEEVYQSLINGKSGITYAEEYKEYNLKSQNSRQTKYKIRRFY
jgi:3-oxoacyl-(acyl-carrier-protein) synthase